MDLDTLKSNADSLLAFWTDFRLPGEYATGPIWSPTTNMLSLRIRDANARVGGPRARGDYDLIMNDNGRITHVNVSGTVTVLRDV